MGGAPSSHRGQFLERRSAVSGHLSLPAIRCQSCREDRFFFGNGHFNEGETSAQNAKKPSPGNSTNPPQKLDTKLRAWKAALPLDATCPRQDRPPRRSGRAPRAPGRETWKPGSSRRPPQPATWLPPGASPQVTWPPWHRPTVLARRSPGPRACPPPGLRTGDPAGPHRPLGVCEGEKRGRGSG